LDSFSIADLQSFSGIKAHTIRIWEQRYNALQPYRSEGNTRYYNGDQLKRLLNIVSLMNEDHKVSKLCSLPDEQLLKLMKDEVDASENKISYNYFISQLISSALLYNEACFDKLFSNSILRFGLKNAYINIIHPALARLGLWWAKDKLHPAQEHFITSLFRQKLYAAADALPPASDTRDTWLLFLPEDEFHEIGLLFSNFLLRQAGKKVIYLGENIPLDSLMVAVKETEAKKILLFLVRKNNRQEDEELLLVLKKKLSGCKIYIACEPGRLNGISSGKNIVQLHSVEAFEKLMENHV
jgi:DNA-binding transcriptional MerR regulator